MPTIVFSLSIFISSTLLFLVQPMFAKTVLPVLGGAPQVWNTCMVFFQALLLAGYAYAHYSVRVLGKGQLPLHFTLMLAVLFFLPLEFPVTGIPGGTTYPATWLIGQLGLFIGLPFFLLSSTAPLLQRWYASVPGTRAGDPYFLYAASNMGSLLALIAYPLIIETQVGLTRQLLLWSEAYLVLFLFLTVAIALTYRENNLVSPASDEPGRGISLWRCLRWILLAFVPSSMMLGLTSFISADLAAAPLIWVIPLSVYLLSFVLTFSRRRLVSHRVFVYSTPALLIILAMLLVSGAVDPLSIFIPIHVLVFFAVSMLCHGELVKDRPEPSRLTLFYLMMSLGGALGGVFNGIVSPLIFNDVLEYPLVLVLAAVICPSRNKDMEATALSQKAMLPANLVFALTPALALLLLVNLLPTGDSSLEPQATGFSSNMLIAFGASLLLCYLAINNSYRFALALCLWMLAGYSVYDSDKEDTLLAKRSYFGVHSVSTRTDTGQHLLYHGSTVHGLQNSGEDGGGVPGMYYHPTGPAGQVFNSYGNKLRHIAIIGLGTGALSSYALEGQAYSYFEIDPVIREIAETESLFDFNSRARERNASIETIIGDARVRLVEQPNAKFDIIVVDAFSSGSIPVHLLTLEALSMYREKLRPGGMLLFHISNHYLELYPVLARLALELRLDAYIQNNIIESEVEKQQGKSASQWMLLVDAETDAKGLEQGIGRWLRLKPASQYPLWTDDFSSLVDVLKL